MPSRRPRGPGRPTVPPTGPPPGSSRRRGVDFVDRLRAEAVAQRRMPLLIINTPEGQATFMADPGGLVEDERLRLVLMCCHPALSAEVASTLALRLVLGVTTADIARLFLVPEPTMAARLTRGKRKIVAAGIPYAVPDAADLPARLDTVAQTAYLAFTAGYAPGSGPDLVRAELAGEAVQLVRVTMAQCPDQPVLQALLALLLLRRLAPRRQGRRRWPARAPARPGPLALAPRRGRGGARPPVPDAVAPHLRARREATGCRRTWRPSTQRRQRHPTRGGTPSVSATPTSWRSTPHRRCGSPPRSRWPSGTDRELAWQPSPSWTGP